VAGYASCASIVVFLGVLGALDHPNTTIIDTRVLFRCTPKVEIFSLSLYHINL
jgi:hypothetical protein